MIVEILIVFRSEHMAAERDPLIFCRCLFPTKKKKVKGREECEMLETSFTLLTSSATAVTSTGDDDFRRFATFIAKKLAKLFATHQK